MKWFDNHWSNVSTVIKIKNIATLLTAISFMIIFISGTIGNQYFDAIINYILDKLLILFTGLTAIAVAVLFQKQHDEDIRSRIEPSDSSEEVYLLEIPTLITCSHNLDKVRNNLRTGIIFIFGISVAILAWIQNFGSVFGGYQSFLLVGGGVLVLCCMIAILFSFSNPIIRLGLENIGEGNVSIDMTKSQYRNTLVAIISEKELQLG